MMVPARAAFAQPMSSSVSTGSAATLFAVGARTEVPVACLLAVTDTFDESGARSRIDDHSLHAAAEAMGAIALGAISR